MKKILCNPINIDYHYQFIKDGMSGEQHISREAADPTFLFYKGKYYIFASMNMSVWVSDDLINWKSVRLPDNLPLLDYAPDVRVIGDYVYFSASKRGEICNFYRTRDIENGPYEEIEGTFDFWDPNLFQDDDGRVYFYWGCSNMTPIWGVELEPETMKPLSERIELVHGRPKELGYERCGENHSKRLIEGEELDRVFEGFKKNMGEEAFSKASDTDKAFFRSMLSNNPFIEGAYMNKHDGKYYLQYAATGAEYNVYNDGVYVSDSPLGPFELAKNNPYSYQPGGFMPGAGHGSTLEDKNGNFWHTSTMRISLNDPMERRVGIWPAGFDNDGELFCNTGYGDWPRSINDGKPDPWAEPEWFLLSRNAKMSASSVSKEDTVSPVGDNNPERACEEDTRTWWRAADNKPGEWLLMDMREVKDVRFIQINFADDSIEALPPGEIPENGFGARLIDERKYVTRYVLEGSSDGENYEILADKSNAETNLPHDTVLIENGKNLRFIKLTILELPMNQKAAVSGLRVFGKGNGKAPGEVKFNATLEGDLDMKVTMSSECADGFNIKWGYDKDKLYHSCMYYPGMGSSKGERTIGALIKGQEVYLQVDAFNENGITHGEVQRLR